jgi:hypothetical protein
MEIWIAIFSCVGAVMKPIKDIKKGMSKSDILFTIISIVSILTLCGLICFNIYDRNKKNSEKDKMSNEIIVKACDQIRCSIQFHNLIIKDYGKKPAQYITKSSIELGGKMLDNIVKSFPEISLNKKMAAFKLSEITTRDAGAFEHDSLWLRNVDSLLSILCKDGGYFISLKESGQY